MYINIRNFKFRLNIKILISHIFGIAALAAFTYFAVSYSKGDFELPFHDRAKTVTAQLEHDISLPDREPTAASTEETTEDITNIIVVVDPDDLIESTTGEDENVYAETTESPFTFEIFSNDMARRGFAVSDGPYEPYNEAQINAEITRYKNEVGDILAQAANAPEDAEPPELPAEPLLYEYKFAQIIPQAKLPAVQKISADGQSKPAVEPFMDYIIIRDGEGEILCDAAAKVITPEFGDIELEILKMRDDYGRTVFKTKDGAYWIYDPAGSDQGGPAFIPIRFNEVLGDRGVPFMYPSYYGANGASGRDRAYNTSWKDRWGYATAGTQDYLIARNYLKTFNFSQGVGIAYQESSGRGSKLSFLDIWGNNYLPLDYSYFAPDEVTEAHLGFFYFDHWLTRVYEREFDRRGNTIVERELIVNLYGTPFYIPEDYNIKSYSNGMILLEKNGYYGFMNYLGEWVAQPIYRHAQPFYEGVAVIGLSNGKKALIDTKGNLITRFRYDAITNCTGGIVALFEKDQGWTIINKVRRQIKVN
ncbi:MAG: WG repeat-containing protein [Oscillospiraceae bacterium]|nr:WG repeat-containing protein [Oscillospiraceae bacterium]